MPIPLRPPTEPITQGSRDQPTTSWRGFFERIGDFLSDQDARFVALEVRMTAEEMARAALDAVAVRRSGDTMTGALTVSMAAPHLDLNRPAAGTDAVLWGRTNGVRRWAIVLGNSVAETGSNVGSNLTIAAFDDAGTFLSTPFAIDRASGAVLIAGTDHAARLASIESRLTAAGIP